MPTNRELTQAVSKEFKLSEKKAAAFLKQKQINPEATAYAAKQIQPGRLKTILKKLPQAIKESGLKVRNLGKRNEDLRREIKQNLEKLAMTGIELETPDKTEKTQKKGLAADYLEKIRRSEDKAEVKKEMALTSGSALARQEAKPPAEARNERQPVKPMRVELAPGFEKIEAAGRGGGEPTAPDIG